MEDLNLHFTGDIHAITAANNLLAAFVDAHILHGHEPKLDPMSIGWRRVVDVNDRNLRDIVTGLGGKLNGIPRQTGFDITAASEVMAIMAMASDLQDLRRRLGAITVGSTPDGEPVTAEQIRCAGAMAALLRDALKPNIIQTLEGQPCLMHCGPFANIAHGNNSLVADRVGLKLGDYLVTESGFALGHGHGEVLRHRLPRRRAGPARGGRGGHGRARCSHHGGGNWRERGSTADQLREIEKGAENLAKHVENAREFGIHAVVAVNRMPGDTDDEVELVRRLAIDAGAANAGLNEAFEHGGKGAADLAEMVADAADQPSSFQFLYPDDAPLKAKIEAIATPHLRRRRGGLPAGGRGQAGAVHEAGLRRVLDLHGQDAPVAVARRSLQGRPTGFRVPIRDVRAYTGAGFLVAAARRDAPDAGPRGLAGGLQHRHRRGRQDRRPLLGGRVRDRLGGVVSQPDDLLGLPLGELLARLASDAPTPAGGALAAITAAGAAAMVEMGATLTLKHERYRGAWPDMEAARDRAAELRVELVRLVDADAHAYAGVIEAMRLPQGDDAARDARATAIADALVGAARPPLAMLAAAAEIAELAAGVAERGNVNLLGDATTAALVGEAAGRAAATLVEIDAGQSRAPEASELFVRARALQVRAGAARTRALAAADGRRPRR